MKIGPAAIKSPYKHFYKDYFLDVYKTNNYMVYYNFC